MTSIRLVIPVKMPSWNSVARQSYWKHKKIFDELKDATAWACKAVKRPRLHFPVKIEVECHWRRKNRRDVDSVLFKPCLDMLVSLGWFSDDSLPYVSEVTYRGAIGCERDEIIVLIKSNET